MRNTLWELGYAVDTLETAVTWHRVEEVLNRIEAALKSAMAPSGETVHVFSHISHLYSSGASVYVTYLFRLAESAQETLSRWRKLKTAASEAVIACQGTISHQHGVGLDHKPYLQAEKGTLGMALIKDSIRHTDPGGVMNPGKLMDTE